MLTPCSICGRISSTNLWHSGQWNRRKALTGNTSRHCRLQVVCAKKKGKAKKGGQKKGPGSLMDLPQEKAEEIAMEPYQETDVIMDNLLLIESFSRNVGRPLLPGDVEMENISEELWNAPFILLAHDVPGPDDPDSPDEPIFSYANKVALEVFEADWSELIGKPSSISAEGPEQEARAKALEGALKDGKGSVDVGWRRSLKGKRFQLHDVTLFNINSPTGAVLGQGAVCGRWQYEDGTVAGPDAPADVSQATTADVSEAETAMEEQASKVRGLKEGEGLSNEDAAVKEAVEELLKRKDKLAKLQRDLAITEQVAA